jgi:hypothetical protein
MFAVRVLDLFEDRQDGLQQFIEDSHRQ